MKFRKILILLLLLITFCSLIGFSFATENVEDINKTPDVLNGNVVDEVISSYSPDEETFIDNDYFCVEQECTLANKSIDGNVFIISQNIDLNNLEVTGSMFVIGEKVNISNTSSAGSLYIVGEDIFINESSFRNVYSISQNEKFGIGSTAFRDIYSLAQKVTIAGNADNVSVMGENVIVDSNTNINNKLEIHSNKEPEIPSNAKIGDYKFVLEKENESQIVIESKRNVLQDNIKSVISYVFVCFIIGIIVIKLNPEFIDKMKKSNIDGVLKSLGIGFLTSALVPIITIIVFIFTLLAGVGIRFSFVLMLLYIIGLMVATPIGCLYISTLVVNKLEKTEKKYLIICLLIVALIAGCLKLIPSLSGIISIVLGFIGLGSIVYLKLKKDNIEE